MIPTPKFGSRSNQDAAVDRKQENDRCETSPERAAAGAEIQHMMRGKRRRAHEAPAFAMRIKDDYCAGLFFSFRHISTAEVGSMALPPSMIC